MLEVKNKQEDNDEKKSHTNSKEQIQSKKKIKQITKANNQIQQRFNNIY